MEVPLVRVRNPEWDEWLTWPMRNDEIIAKVLAEPRGATTFKTSGLALEKIRWASPLLWLVALITPLVAWGSGTCPTGENIFGDYNTCIWVPYFFVWCWISWKEWEALKLAIIPYCELLHQPLHGNGRSFSILGQEVSCKTYLLYVGTISGLSKMDLVSNGLMLSKVLMSIGCKFQPHRLWDLWETVVDASVLRFIPICYNIQALVFIAWMMMFGQAACHLLHGLPWVESDRTLQYGYESEGGGYHTVWQAFRHWLATRGVPRVTHVSPAELARHADCLRVTASTCRMVSLVDKDPEWIIARAEELSKRGPHRKLRQAVAMIKKECARSNMRVLLITIVERGLMLEIQVTLFALSHRILREQHGRESRVSCGENTSIMACMWLKVLSICVPLNWNWVDGQILFSMCISYLCYLKASVDNFLQWKRLEACRKRLVEEIADDTAPDLLTLTEKHLHVLLGGCIVAFLIFLHVTAKIIAAFRCNSGFFDLPVDFDRTKVTWYGCVKNSTFGHPAELWGQSLFGTNHYHAN